MSRPSVVDALIARWGQPAVDLSDWVERRTSARRTWVWFPEENTGHHGNHTLHADREGGRYTVEALGGRCCPVRSVAVVTSEDPNDGVYDSVAGQAFGLFTEVMEHALTKARQDALRQVERELLREARFQEEMSRSGPLRPGFAGVSVHTYARNRFLDVEGAVEQMGRDVDPRRDEKFQAVMVTPADLQQYPISGLQPITEQPREH